MIIKKSSDFTAERTCFILVQSELQTPHRQLGKKENRKFNFLLKHKTLPSFHPYFCHEVIVTDVQCQHLIMSISWLSDAFFKWHQIFKYSPIGTSNLFL